MPGASVTRFVDIGNSLGNFADEVLVRCARCDVAGKVSATWTPCRWSASFRCLSCQWALSSAACDWAGPLDMVGRRPCGYCGHKWLTIHKRLARFANSVANQVPAQCPECGHTSQVDVKVQRCASSGDVVDPHFGMPLYLTQNSRFGRVWAYNSQHVQVLKAYVSATLRIRTGGGSRAMFARLPLWMKRAKNRPEVLKSLQRLDALVDDFAVQRIRARDWE